MASLALSNGGVALIDDADLDLVRHVEWRRFTVAKTYHYVATRGKNPTLLHRWLMLPPRGFVVDHINGDSLDNRRENLRVCTQAENTRNTRRSVSSTQPFKGIQFQPTGKRRRRWRAAIGTDCQFIGAFHTPEEAAAAYDIAAVLRYGEFACLNFPHVFPEISSRKA